MSMHEFLNSFAGIPKIFLIVNGEKVTPKNHWLSERCILMGNV
jgi:hypothetical protein